MMQGPRGADHQQFVTTGVVSTLGQRPELRDLFPLADEVDVWVRWSA
jgi:hypothetical protein